MDNQQQFYPESPTRQLPPMPKPKPLYKKWWSWVLIGCNLLLIGFLLAFALSFYNQSKQYEESLQQYENKLQQTRKELKQSEQKIKKLEKESSTQLLPLDKEMLSSINEILSFNDKILPNVGIGYDKKTFSLFALFNFHVNYCILKKEITDIQQGIAVDFDTLSSAYTNYSSSSVIFLLAEKYLYNLSEEDYNEYSEKITERSKIAYDHIIYLDINKEYFKPEALNDFANIVSESYNIVLDAVKSKKRAEN